MKVNKINALKLVLPLTLVLAFASCSKNASKNKSSATGWNLNDKKGGFQIVFLNKCSKRTVTGVLFTIDRFQLV